MGDFVNSFVRQFFCRPLTFYVPMKRINSASRANREVHACYTFITRDRIDFGECELSPRLARPFRLPKILISFACTPINPKSWLKARSDSIRFDSELTFELVNTGIIDRYTALAIDEMLLP